jgi:putative ABC transport system permease protein
MTRLALRSLAVRKLRTGLTAVAIVLGVAMVAGTYIETDEIRDAFDDITARSVEGIDVVVTPREEFTAQVAFEPPPIRESLVARIERVPGVATAQEEVTALGHLVIDGEVVETMGAPAFVSGTSPEEFDPTELVSGRRPELPGEAALLDQNAQDQGVELGDEIGIATRRGIETVEVVGLVSFDAAVGGTTVVSVPTRQLQSWFGLEGQVSSIDVLAEPGVSAGDLALRVDQVLPPSARAQTASENAAEASSEVNNQIGRFLTPALLALAGAAVMVGAFIIFNTFSITVAQRTREFAMLRALGATRGQVLTTIGGEALLIGCLASALGLAAGVGFAALINSLFDAVGFGIPHSGTIVAPRTVAVSAGVGIGVTLLAALLPAIRATRVSPIAAMAGVAARETTRRRRRAVAAAVLSIAAGITLTAQGLFGSGPAATRLGGLAVGAIFVFVGLALSARYLVSPLARLIGYPVQRLFGTPGKLARENAERNPGRTAVTSAALMVGLGLVVFVAVFAAGIRSSIGKQIDELVRADIFVYGQDFQPFPAGTGRAIARVDGVETVAPLLFDELEVNGRSTNITTDVLIGLDPTTLSSVYRFEWLEGGDELLARLGRGETLIEEQFATRHDLNVGDSYEAVTPAGKPESLTAVGIYRDPTILQGSLGSLATLRSISHVRDPVSLLVSIDDDADAAAVEAAVDRAVERFPTAAVENRAEYRETIQGQLDQIVYLLYALLALSIVISLFGIANSLFLSIHERTGELGVLRAIGATRTQVRRVIRYESVITAVIGGLLGTAVGIVFGWLVIESLSEFGFSLAIPVGQLAVFMLLAVAVGVVGAIAPARRAARIDVLEAVREE